MGTSSIFLSDSLIKLTPGTKLEEDKDYGIKGFTSECQFIKSRSNSSGRRLTLIFNQEYGFDNLLTNIQFLKESKLLQGSGHGYYIETCPNIKFKMKNIHEVYNTNDEFKTAFDNYIKDVYTEFLSAPPVEVEDEFLLQVCLDDVKGIWLANDGKAYLYNEANDDCEELPDYDIPEEYKKDKE